MEPHARMMKAAANQVEDKRESAFDDALKRCESALSALSVARDQATSIRSTLIGRNESDSADANSGPVPQPFTYEQKLNDFANRLNETVANLNNEINQISRF